MNGPDTSGEYIVGGAPQYIRDLFRNGTRDLKRWKKTATIEQLEDAYDFIRRDMPHLLEEVEKELNLRRHKELAEHLNQLKKPHWTLVPTFWLVIIGCAAGIVAAVMDTDLLPAASP